MDLTDYPAKAQTESVSLTKRRMRARGKRGAPASLPFSDFSYVHSLKCTGARKVTGAYQFTEAASPEMASPTSSVFASISLRE